MSTAATTWVWKHSQAEDSDRLVLLAIADAADADGDNAWPSLDTIAQFVKKSERTVRRSIRSLEELGELEVEIKAGGKRDQRTDRRPNLYRLTFTTNEVRPDVPDPSLANASAPDQVNDRTQQRPDVPDPSWIHDRTREPSRPDTPGTTTTGHCCPIEQNQNIHLERGEIEAESVDNSESLPARVSELRSLIGPRQTLEASAS